MQPQYNGDQEEYKGRTSQGLGLFKDQNTGVNHPLVLRDGPGLTEAEPQLVSPPVKETADNQQDNACQQAEEGKHSDVRHTTTFLNLYKRSARASQSTRLIFTSTALPINFFCSAWVPIRV